MAALVSKQVTATIPIVFGLAGDPLGNRSCRQPGETGILELLNSFTPTDSGTPNPLRRTGDAMGASSIEEIRNLENLLPTLFERETDATRSARPS
jgi:hypothetical protein